MDRYVSRTKDFKPSDIPSFVSNEKQILLEVVSNLQDLENEGKITLKDSLKVNTRTLRKIWNVIPSKS